MGYIRIPTTTKGPVIINANKILTVGIDSGGNYIDLVLDFTGDGNRIELRFFNAASALNQSALIQYNNAVIAAQNSAVVDITPREGQEINNFAYNPAP
jgi:hypothetical protein